MIPDGFARLYDRLPRWVARAPGRVNLIGEHTDYNDGFVLPMAIERHTEIAAAPNDLNSIVLRSTASDEIVCIDLTRPVEPEAKGRWANYPKGVVAGFIQAGYSLRGFDALVQSTVPLGGGLASSASLEVCLATLIAGIIEAPFDQVEKARMCHYAENRFAQVPCGIMDQFACALGREDHLLLLDCRSQESQWVELSSSEVSVLIVRTHVRHQLAHSEYPVRRAQCSTAARRLGLSTLRDATLERLEQARPTLDGTIFRRARHVVSENERTLQAVLAIRAADWIEFGELMYGSHRSLKTDFDVSSQELDAVVEIAASIGPQGGVFGCRMTGGGFGGCAVALIERRAQDQIVRKVIEEYLARTGTEPEVFISRPAGGATFMRLAE